MTPDTLRLATYNVGLLDLHIGPVQLAAVPFSKERLRPIVDALQNLPVDVLCLQEVFRKEHRINFVERLQPSFPFVARHDTGGFLRLTHGLLIFSRFPISRSGFFRFRRAALRERLFVTRGFLAADVRFSPDLSLTIIDTHTTAGGSGGPEAPYANDIREKQIMELHEYCAKEDRAALVCGDFNAGPEASRDNYHKMLELSYVDSYLAGPQEARRRSVTWDPNNSLNKGNRFAQSPPQRVDHVFLNAKAVSLFDIGSARITLEDAVVSTPEGIVPLSDHNALIVTLQTLR